ncbi:MAG TPA: DegT/DnrJ/EryC1/StrS family aminotransferase, partial [Anaerolineales bacterium]|nr:DegT/DnrJ/EryC1/StrS family aminotransferase [Anaerolineales bacterium]
PELAAKVRMLRDHGSSQKYHHKVVGVNSRMDGLQGAVLGVKLRHLPNWNEERRRKAEMYREQLNGVDGIILPREMDYAQHIYHIFAVRVRNRDALMAALTEKGVGCGIHYPVPVHLQEAYSFMGMKKGQFPVAEKCADELVSLPMFAELAEEQIEYVAYEIKSFLRHYRPVATDMTTQAQPSA